MAISNTHAPEDTSPTPASPGSFRAALKLATEPLHVALDRALGGAFRSREAYVGFLRGSHAALAWLTPAIERFGAMGARDGALRVEHIARDLAALGADPGPAPDLSWRPSSVAEAFGCAYVVEGSALGGLVLARTADEALRLDGLATSYLRLRGPDTARHWRAFLDVLEQWSARASTAERRAAAEGAACTFLTYRRALEAAGVISEAS